jgi:hypothetical protein
MSYVRDCLASVLNSNYPNFEVVFTDNRSSDGSIEYVSKTFGNDRRLKVIETGANYGFAKGNNIGAKYSTGHHLVFLNIDTIVDRDWLTILVEFLGSHRNVGIVQCKLKLMDDRKVIDCVGHFIDWFGISFVKGHGERDEGQYDTVNEIFAAGGAAFAIRRSVFRRLGGFDEDFFMLFEEDDLCWRAWIAGVEIMYLPSAVVYHKSGAIRSTMGAYRNLFLSRRNRIMSMLKNYSAWNLLRFMPISILLVFAIAFFTKNKLEYIKAYGASLISVLRNSRAIIRKRRIVARNRVVSDRYLISRGIIRKPILREMSRKGY